MKQAAPFLLALILIVAADAAAAPAPWARGGSRAEDLVVRLVTIGPSWPLYTWWGHSALIVEDRRLGQSRFYNYGLFSFDQERFVLDFCMGRLWFQVGATDTNRELAYYRRLERSIHLQTLDLSAQRRLELAVFLETNILPENRTYLYDHYNDNCATRVRDLIDRSIDGQLAAATSGPGRMSLRQHTRRFTSHAVLMDWALMFLMSGLIDRPVSRWQEMFLPSELERNLAGLRYRDDEGRERPLVSETVVLYEPAEQRAIPQQAPAHWPWSLVLGAAFGLLLLLPILLLRPPGSGAPSNPRASSARRAALLLWGAGSALAGLVFGGLGSVLFFMSVFTDHTVTYANQNLFLANPLTLLALPLGLAVMVGGDRSGGRRHRPGGGCSGGHGAVHSGGGWQLPAAGWLALLWYVLAGIAALYLVLKLLRVFEQKNLLAAAAVVPVLFTLAAASQLIGKKAGAPTGIPKA